MAEQEEEKKAGEGGTEETPQQFNALESLSQEEGTEKKGSNAEAVAEAIVHPPQTKLRKFLGFFNVYLLIFLLLVVIAGIVFVVSYLNSQKEPEVPATSLQNLTQEQLTNIANGGDATVGDPRYVLNIQSDAVFAGGALIRGDLSVAGNIQLGKELTLPNLTVSGTSNLGKAQAATLAVAGETIQQGKLSALGGLQVGGNSTFGGILTASSITTGSLTLAGSGNLTLNNHLNIGGDTPNRSNGAALGSGGTSSISGSDTAGTITINTGSSAPAGCFLTVTFRQAFSGTPQVQITPASAAAGNTTYYVTRSSTNFSVCAATTPPSGSNLIFDYFIVN